MFQWTLVDFTQLRCESSYETEEHVSHRPASVNRGGGGNSLVTQQLPSSSEEDRSVFILLTLVTNTASVHLACLDHAPARAQHVCLDCSTDACLHVVAMVMCFSCFSFFACCIYVAAFVPFLLLPSFFLPF